MEYEGCKIKHSVHTICTSPIIVLFVNVCVRLFTLIDVTHTLNKITLMKEDVMDTSWQGIGVASL